MKIKTSEVVYREDLYPRSITNPAKVQEYALNLEIMPPIEVNQHNILIDGWHRWTAHKKNEVEEIEVVVIETASDRDLLFLAIEKNNAHGLQLSAEDKKDKARSLYHATAEKDRPEFKKRLPGLFSVTVQTVNNWLSRIDKDTEVKQKKEAFDLWLACHTQQEIADKIGKGQKTISRWIDGTEDKSGFSQNEKLLKMTKIQFKDDFDPPIYNVWKKQTKTTGVSHFGNSEPEWLENLLYLYTEPFDIVLDPFAGGGSTIDVCKKRGRRYFVSDRKPIVEREKEIRKHDITSGCPSVPRWKDVKLVYLDPPYWKQAAGQYSDDPEDLANMDLDTFNSTLAGMIKNISKKLQPGSVIALVIQPTQWKAPEKQFTDHVFDMMRLVNLPVDMRYSVPYESQQCNAQMVIWAKENKKCLVLTREIIAWRI
jgi:hypothetical protein